MRKMYLKSVLRQDVGFFDANATASMTHEVVTAMSNDAHVIQDVLSEKVLFLLPCLLSFSLLIIR